METKVCSKCCVEQPLFKFFNGYKKDKVTRRIIPVCHHCRYKQRLISDPTHLKKRHLKKFYNLTMEKYKEILDQQNGLCGICHEKKSSYTVDHDHSCCPGEQTCGNCIRGLLCHGCNRGIGQFKDDVDKLKSAIRYLDSHKSKTPH